MIGPCTCKSEQQDAIHGEGRRVFNPCGTQENPMWKCTVCLKMASRAKKEVIFTGRFVKKEGESKDV